MNLHAAIQEFILASGADGLRDKTIGWYRSILGKFGERLGKRQMDVITANEIRAYLVYLREAGYSPETVSGHSRALHRFFRWCASEYNLPNPMANIKYPRQPKPAVSKSVMVEDVIKLLEACDESWLGKRDKAMIAFLMDTGCRAAGLCSLKMVDLDMVKYRAYVVEKGQKRRALMFSDLTAHLLREWLYVRSDVQTVFHSRNGLSMTPDSLLHMINRLKERAGVKGRVNPHAFRHGFAREYLKQGGDLATLSRLMGHTNPATTAMFYGVFAEDELAEAHRKHTPMREIKLSSSDDENERSG